MYTWLLEPVDNISFILSVVDKRSLTVGRTFIPLCGKKSFKTQHGRIPIDPAILAAINWTSFHCKKGKLKTPTRGSEGTRPETGDIFAFRYRPILIQRK